MRDGGAGGMGPMMRRMRGGAVGIERFALRLAIALLIGGVLLPALMAITRHGPLPPPHVVARAAPRSCIEGTCHEAERCIQAVMKRVILRPPAPVPPLVALLLVALPVAWQARSRVRPPDWWWPPDRRRAFLQVFLI
jgi:hypothetical protein